MWDVRTYETLTRRDFCSYTQGPMSPKTPKNSARPKTCGGLLACHISFCNCWGSREVGVGIGKVARENDRILIFAGQSSRL